ncbi:hypothetical protein L1887_61797 [Cichorium endivia]|nr:hypothetical protein L1887_61797 [Cichorium endivia]
MRGHAARGLGALGRLDGLFKDPPELEFFVVTHGGEHLAVWAEARVQHALLVRLDLGDLGARRVRPDAHEALARLGGAEAVRRDDLAVVRRPVQRGDLRARRDGHGPRVLRRVPKVDVAVARATARSQQAQVVWTPGKRLDGGLVVLLAHLGDRGAAVPHLDDIVVASRSHERAVGSPLHAADGTVMRLFQRSRHRISLSHVVFADDAALESCVERTIRCPGSRVDRGVVGTPIARGLERAHARARLHIPDLHKAALQTHSEDVAIGIPSHSSDQASPAHLLRLCRCVEQCARIARVAVPDPQPRLQRHRHHVGGRPVEQIIVEVAHHARRIQRPLWCGWDPPTACALQTAR